jgi:hypothetical protein
MEALSIFKFSPIRQFGALVGVGFALCACSFQLPASSPPAVTEDVTGSIPHSPLASSLDPEECRRAHSALAAALDPQGNGIR